MSAHAMNPVLEVCKNITADGQLTVEEVWMLAGYLNDHPEERTIWPGNVLFPVLMGVFVDGRLTDQEMEVLAAKLAQVERQARAQAREMEPEPGSGNDLIEAFEASIPNFPFVMAVPSGREPSEEVVADLKEITCTCPEWAEARSTLRPGHPSRCCRHVVVAYRSAPPAGPLDDWFQALLADCSDRGRGTPPDHEWLILPLEDKPVVVSYGQEGFANIYAPIEQRYNRFGYDLSRDFWSYGICPPASRRIVRFLKTRAIPARD